MSPPTVAGSGRCRKAICNAVRDTRSGPRPHPEVGGRRLLTASSCAVADRHLHHDAVKTDGSSGSAGASGNRARDHLANERTYLAWLRTALAIVALGAILAKITDNPSARVVAAAALTVTFGVVALGYGTARYYRVARDLEHDEFQPAGRGPLVIAVLVLAAVAVVLPLLLI
jgi:putative membrane protein